MANKNYAMIFNATDGLKKVDMGEDSYEFLRSSVDGYIDGLYVNDFGKGIALWINDEGKFREDFEVSAVLDYDGKIYDHVVGNIVFTGISDEGETLPLSAANIAKIKKVFNSTKHVLITNKAKDNIMIVPCFHY